LVIGFTDHFKIVIKSNHIALTNSRTRLLTAVPTKSSTSTLRVAWQRLSIEQLPQLLRSTVPVLADRRSVCLGYSAADRQSFLVCLLAIHDPRFLFSPRHVRVSKWASSPREEESVSLCRCYVCCTVVSAGRYSRCYGVQVTMDCASFVIAVY
jgi:hypothetical protein